jgi:hypothetical protein
MGINAHTPIRGPLRRARMPTNGDSEEERVSEEAVL